MNWFRRLRFHGDALTVIQEPFGSRNWFRALVAVSFVWALHLFVMETQHYLSARRMTLWIEEQQRAQGGRSGDLALVLRALPEVGKTGSWAVWMFPAEDVGVPIRAISTLCVEQTGLSYWGGARCAASAIASAGSDVFKRTLRRVARRNRAHERLAQMEPIGSPSFV